MHNKTNVSTKIIGLLLIGILLFSLNVSGVSAGNLLDTPTPTPTGTPFTCTSWNLAADFETGLNQENPNRDSCNNLGVWAFMGSGNLTRNPVNYYLLPIFSANYGGYPNLNTYHNSSQFPHLGFNAGPDAVSGSIIIPANTFDVHPASGEMGIIAWHSPVNGYINISGGVSDNSPGCGDGILWYIDKGATNVASGSFLNGGSQLFANGTNGANLNSIAVSVGDVIYLAIHPNGNYVCDDTRVDLTISVTSASTNTPTQTATLKPTATRTATATFTSTATRTATVKPTSTPTVTATFTLTNTPVATFTFSATATPSPNSGGSGTCWVSKSSWASYSVSYAIDRNSIPISLGWDTSINAAAQTWNNVTPSHLKFTYSANSNNIISYRVPPNEEFLAQVYPHHLTSLFNITEKQMDINPNYAWDTNNTPDPSSPDSNGSTTTYNIQNVVTHEFGHWLQLEDIPDQNCKNVTMFHTVKYGEIKKITLDSADEEAINWQYP